MPFNRDRVEDLLVATGRRCCICLTLHSVQVHHIEPLNEGGTDDIDNAITLCPNCHDQVHGTAVPGRITRIYTSGELKKHRQQTIERVDRMRMVIVEERPPSETALEILKSLNSGSINLTTAVTDSLAFARRTGNQALEIFCEEELRGYEGSRFADESIAYRLIEVQVSLEIRLNPSKEHWGNSANLFEHLRSDPELSHKFFKRTLLLNEPLLEIEESSNKAEGALYYSVHLKLANIIDNPANPDTTVYSYLNPAEFSRVCRSVRTRLTDFLLSAK